MTVQPATNTEPSRYEEFTYWNEGPCQWTVIGDEECNRIKCFTHTVTGNEVSFWCRGYQAGKLEGKRIGEANKVTQIKRALGL